MNNRRTNDLDDIYLETIRKRHKHRHTHTATMRTKRYRKSLDSNSPYARFSSFMHQEVGLDGFGIIPPQYTGITFLTLLLTLPKFLGMGFFFFYLSGGNVDIYNKVHTGDFLLDWVIGYEVFATVTLLIIGKNLVETVFFAKP
jgi:hypothetical protein